ncbi:TetR/AcrR family transcriptional regulator [Marisediminicola sp. LYQ134]|uniref:TetR/AcrR family transcriptional regulator n=1 Tax=unclassified Marisediminicola TaxID=2618316 RepID=UPI003983569A
MPVVDSNPTAQRALDGTAPADALNVPHGPGAKKRILDTADRLFYSEGIRAVGIDRLISESAVTKATFYKHYGSKDTVIAEYLRGRHERIRETAASLQAMPPVERIRAIAAMISTQIGSPDFRGCSFLNAAAEFPDPSSTVRRIIEDHRDWYSTTLTDLVRDAGHPLPGDAADELLLARDGAMSGGYAGDAIAASAALVRNVERVLADIPD